jgi:hypothetical protein
MPLRSRLVTGWASSGCGGERSSVRHGGPPVLPASRDAGEHLSGRTNRSAMSAHCGGAPGLDRARGRQPGEVRTGGNGGVVAIVEYVADDARQSSAPRGWRQALAYPICQGRARCGRRRVAVLLIHERPHPASIDLCATRRRQAPDGSPARVLTSSSLT